MRPVEASGLPVSDHGVLHIRHGVIVDPALGYRAVREVDGKKSWVGPWRREETGADEDVAHAQQALREAMADAGAQIVHRPNDDIGYWLPTERSELPT